MSLDLKDQLLNLTKEKNEKKKEDILAFIETKVTFDEIYKKFGGEKRELGDLMREIEKLGTIIYSNNTYYKIDKLNVVEGWVTGGTRGGLFFTDKKPNLELGSNYELENELSIINKKNLLPMSKITGYDVDGRVYVKEVVEAHDFDFLGLYDNGNVKVFMKGLDLSFDMPEEQSKSLNVTEPTWFHFNYNAKENITNIIKEVTKNNTKYTYSDLTRYIIDQNKNNNEYIDMPIIDMAEVDSLRVDATHIPFATIDNITTKDIDDAIYFDKEKQILYVAISDASHYINKDMDVKAQEKTTTYYLPNRVDSMVDKEYSQNIMSLNPYEVKKAIICEINLSSGLNLDLVDNNIQFYPANIISKARLTYKDLDNYLQTGSLNSLDDLEFKTDKSQLPVIQSILDNFKSLYQIAKTNEENNPEPYVYRPTKMYPVLDENGVVQSIEPEDIRLMAQKVVEFSMVQANTAAAKYIHARYPSIALFRNYTVDGEKTKAEYANQVNQADDVETKFYTHFTSPIRRYCDLLVHRMIKEIIVDKKLHTEETLANISNKINSINKRVKIADRKIQDLMCNDFVKQKGITEDECSIIELTPSGVVFRGQQNVEYFVLASKIDRRLCEKIDKFFMNFEDGNIVRDEKYRDFINELNNQKYKLSLQVIDPVLDKKQCIQDNRPTRKPRM